MKINVQIVDTHSGISQYGMIDEPVREKIEIANALAHFGPNICEIDWIFDHSNGFICKTGIIKDTTKVVNIIAYE